MVEHGVDIATAVDVSAAIYQRSLGADVYIVGGWRYDPDLKWYSQKGISDIQQLKGKRLGIREREGLVYGFMANLLLQAGIDPEKEVTWVFDPVFGYGNDPKHVDMLRDGAVDAMPSFPPFFKAARSRRIPCFDGPASGIPAQTGKSDRSDEEDIESRADELRALLSGHDSRILVYARYGEFRLSSRARNATAQ